MKRLMMIMCLVLSVLILSGGPVLAQAAEVNHFIDEVPYKMKEDYPKMKAGETYEELLENLKLFKKDNPSVEKLIEEFDKLPDAMKYMVGKNPMLIGLSLDYLYGFQLDFSLGESIALNRPVPYYLQWDRRWGNKMYGPEELAINGCGPTSLAMVFSALKQDPDITPLSIIEKAQADDVTWEGTTWKFMKSVGKHFDIRTREIEFKESTMKKNLDDGKYLIATINGGEYIGFPHLFAIIGYNEEGFIVNDPVLYENTLKTWTYDQLIEIQAIWSYENR